VTISGPGIQPHIACGYAGMLQARHAQMDARPPETPQERAGRWKRKNTCSSAARLLRYRGSQRRSRSGSPPARSGSSGSSRRAARRSPCSVANDLDGQRPLEPASAGKGWPRPSWRISTRNTDTAANERCSECRRSGCCPSRCRHSNRHGCASHGRRSCAQRCGRIGHWLARFGQEFLVQAE